MMENRVSTRSRKSVATTGNIDEWTPQSDASRSSSPTCEMDEDGEGEVSLRSILNELRGFRQDNKHQLTEIKQELHKTNNRLEEAETRIDEVETAIQTMTTLEIHTYCILNWLHSF